MKRRLILIFLVFLLVTVCSYKFIWMGTARITADFKVLPSDNRILYEIVAETLAEKAARHLSPAIKVVESKQYGTFKQPIRVYAFSSTKSFSQFSGVPEGVKGAGLKNEVFLSGKLLKIMDEVQGVLTHELSHVQLSQTLGVIKFNRNLPRWFREGLAIYVSDGGGATNASKAETIEQFIKGINFYPETKGALLNWRLPGPKGLKPKIFYRQSGMLVQYIAHTYPMQFETFLKGVQEGENFETYFVECFSISVNDMLQTFIVELKKT